MRTCDERLDEEDIIHFASLSIQVQCKHIDVDAAEEAEFKAIFCPLSLKEKEMMLRMREPERAAFLEMQPDHQRFFLSLGARSERTRFVKIVVNEQKEAAMNGVKRVPKLSI
jgi:hypothetical protein